MENNAGQWFVVHTLSGQENKVKDTMERQLKLDDELKIYEILVPIEKVTEVRQGRKTTTSRKFFPGYILIRMDLYGEDMKQVDEKTWYFVRQTQGVIGFVGGGDKPMPLMPYEVDDLLNQINGQEEKAKPKIQYELGETVRIRDGAFENFEGKIEEIDSGRGKLKLMVSIFGRSTPVELEFWQVERE